MDNLEDEKKEGEKSLKQLQKTCDKNEKEANRLHTKEVNKLTEEGKEIGALLQETVTTLEYHKTQA